MNAIARAHDQLVTESEADAIADAGAGLEGALFIEPTLDGAAVGLAVGKHKITLQAPSYLLASMARKLLETALAAPLALIGTEDVAAMAALLIDDESRAAMAAQAAAEARLAAQADRMAALELGRQEAAREMAQALVDMVVVLQMQPGTERYIEAERLAPMVRRARALLERK
jgi:hypothetical protein